MRANCCYKTGWPTYVGSWKLNNQRLVIPLRRAQKLMIHPLSAPGQPGMGDERDFTYHLSSSCHVAITQHNPANHLCQPLQFVPHSSSSIRFFPFLSPPSFSMLSLVFPVFAAPLGPRLMQSCSRCLDLSSWCGRWISIFSIARPHWGFFLSQPSSGLLCL